MNDPLLATLAYPQLWHIAPLIVAVSLVYGATRHEQLGEILSNAFKFGLWIVGFIGVIFAILYFVANQL